MHIFLNFTTRNTHITSIFMWNEINFGSISYEIYCFWFYKWCWIIYKIFYISTNFTFNMSIKPKFLFLKTSTSCVRCNSISLNTCHFHFIGKNIFWNCVHCPICTMYIKVLLFNVKWSVHCGISSWENIYKSCSIHFIVIVICSIVIICCKCFCF